MVTTNDTQTALAVAISGALSVATEQDATYEYSCEPGSPYVRFLVRFLTDDLIARGVRLVPAVPVDVRWTSTLESQLSREQAEVERLGATLVEIWECSRSLTGYCQWCDARPEINHQLDCPAELALDAIFATTQEDVERLGLSSEQTVILREHLTKRQQTVSEFLGDILMEYGLGRAMGKEYPPPSIQFPQHGYARSTNELE